MDFPEHISIDKHIIKVVPRYSETDQGGVVHHSVYPVYFEIGRTELLRVNKVAYKDLEAAGIFFVVAELKIRYRKPARYDEQLLLETRCIDVKETRIEHGYKLTRESDGTILAEGSSVLACVGPDGKLRRIPDFMFFQTKNQTV